MAMKVVSGPHLFQRPELTAVVGNTAERVRFIDLQSKCFFGHLAKPSVLSSPIALDIIGPPNYFMQCCFRSEPLPLRRLPVKMIDSQAELSISRLPLEIELDWFSSWV